MLGGNFKVIYQNLFRRTEHNYDKPRVRDHIYLFIYLFVFYLGTS
jgi:hypothetical protein